MKQWARRVDQILFYPEELYADLRGGWAEVQGFVGRQA